MVKHQAHEKHPVGLWYVALCYAFFTFAFGMVNSLAVLYMTRKLHIDAKTAYGLFAGFVAMVFTLPLIGGYLAGRLGYKETASVGTAVVLIGMMCLAFPSKMMLFWGLGLFAAGYGLCTPAFMCLASFLYDNDDPRRDSGCTLFYVTMNLGFLISGFAGGYIARYWGYNAAFLIAGIMLFCCLGLFWGASKWIQAFPGRTIAAEVSWSRPVIIAVLVLSCVVMAPIVAWLLNHDTINNIVLFALAIVSFIAMFSLAWQQDNQRDRLRVLAFIILVTVAQGFWIIYMFEPSLLTIFIADNVDRAVGSTTIPPSSFYSLDPIFVIILGVCLGFVWRYLERRKKAPSLPLKFSLGLVIMGTGCLVLVAGIFEHNHHFLVGMGWVISSYFFLSLAELFVAPIGIAMVGKLSPRGSDGWLMGVWNLLAGTSAVGAGFISSATVLKSTAPKVTDPVYMHAFLIVGLGAMLAGFVAMFMIPMVKRFVGNS